MHLNKKTVLIHHHTSVTFYCFTARCFNSTSLSSGSPDSKFVKFWQQMLVKARLRFISKRNVSTTSMKSHDTDSRTTHMDLIVYEMAQIYVSTSSHRLPISTYNTLDLQNHTESQKNIQRILNLNYRRIINLLNFLKVLYCYYLSYF